MHVNDVMYNYISSEATILLASISAADEFDVWTIKKKSHCYNYNLEINY